MTDPLPDTRMYCKRCDDEIIIQPQDDPTEAELAGYCSFECQLDDRELLIARACMWFMENAPGTPVPDDICEGGQAALELLHRNGEIE